MSASRERKKRMVESEQAAPQQAKKTKKKLSEGWIFAIIVILIPVIVFGVIFGVQASWRNATVVSVGDHKVSTTEFNYFYRGALNSIYSTYGSYISLLGIDTSTPLDEQSYAGSDEYDTWADFLADSAKTSAVDAYTVYDKAVEAGFSLSDDDKASIDNEINTLKTYAGVYSMDLDEYIEAMFGKGCNEKNYRHYLEVSKLHDAYIESLTYTEDERNARYEQDTTEFDTVTYYSYAVKASDFETKSDSSTDSTEATTSTEPSEEAIAAAREAANAMVSDFKTDDENVSVMTERSKSEVTSSISEDAANWLYTEAKPGEAKLFEKDNTFYVLQLTSINDNNYQTVNALQLNNVVATIANKGVKQQQSIIKSTTDANGKTTESKKGEATRVVDEKVASDMMNAMESVAEGYNKFVKVDGYRMAAKSGTAEVQGSDGTLSSIISDYSVVIPADNPRYAVTVVMKDPNGVFGGLTAGPVSAQICEFLMQKYEVPVSGPRKNAIPVTW